MNSEAMIHQVSEVVFFPKLNNSIWSQFACIVASKKICGLKSFKFMCCELKTGCFGFAILILYFPFQTTMFYLQHRIYPSCFKCLSCLHRQSQKQQFLFCEAFRVQCTLSWFVRTPKWQHDRRPLTRDACSWAPKRWAVHPLGETFELWVMPSSSLRT